MYGRRVDVAGGYKKTGSNRVAFHVGAYDSTQPLIVDPILFYSTYLGGSGQDFALGIAVDYEGNAFVTGLTSSLDFPRSSSAPPACAANFSNGYPDCTDVFITVMGLGSSWGSTYLGGTSRDLGTGAAEPGFFRLNASQPTSGRGFAARLVPDGSALVYSRYLDGDGIGTGIAVAGPYTYVTGVMPGSNWPAPAGPGGGPTDAFIEV